MVGEIIKLESDRATIQIYESPGTLFCKTSLLTCLEAGVSVGDPVWKTGQAMMVELGPGIMESVYDGLQRPLRRSSMCLPPGIKIPPLNHEKKWEFTPTKQLQVLPPLSMFFI